MIEINYNFVGKIPLECDCGYEFSCELKKKSTPLNTELSNTYGIIDILTCKKCGKTRRVDFGFRVEIK